MKPNISFKHATLYKLSLIAALLFRLGLIEKCGTGKTSSGCSAGMYRLTEKGCRWLQ